MVRLSRIALVAVPSHAVTSKADLSAKEVEVNGVRLHYVEQGSGEPIVFVHGATARSSRVGAG